MELRKPERFFAPFDSNGSGLRSPEVRPELDIAFTVYKPENVLPKDISEDINRFFRRQFEINHSILEKGEANMNAQDINMLRIFIALQDGRRYLAEAINHPESSFITIARDQVTGEIIGFSSSYKLPGEPSNTDDSFMGFVGVSLESKYNRRSIGLRLNLLRGLALLESGETQYTTNVWRQSESMYIKAGVTYQRVEALSDWLGVEPRSKIRVLLDQQELTSACVRFGLQPTTKPQTIHLY